ncbi:MAG TPA: sodium/solute symporter [bacterium]|nr:sodium/solute symporter [bacterium]HQO33320.1 sodium/solute symporter [bacterium]HQP99415.1 sodium/solute symporter [bacterium]
MAAYAIGMLAIGWWYSRRQDSTEEYFVAGRGISSTIAGISIIATLLSSISYLATPGEVIKNGPGWIYSIFHAPISFLVVGYLMIPFLKAEKVTSGYTLLEKRLGKGIRRMSSGVFVLSRLFWMGLVVYTCSFAVVTITGLPLRPVLIGVGLIGTLYTVWGGIRAVMITDIIQFAILVGGLVVTIVFIAIRCGGFSVLWPDMESSAIQSLNWPKIRIFSLNPFDRMTAFSVILYVSLFWICTATSDQVVIQRFLCTRDVRSARRSFGLTVFFDAVLNMLMVLTGLALLHYFLEYPQNLPIPNESIPSQADRLFPHFIAAIFPTGITGLVIAALFAAAMSSLDSGISSISTVLVTDFPHIFLRGANQEESRKLRRARFLALATGLAAISMSLIITIVPGKNLLEMTIRISSLFTGPLFVLFAMAFYLRSSTPAGAWAALIVGFLTGLTMTYWEAISGALWGKPDDFSVLLIMPTAITVSILIGILVSHFTRPCDQGERG